MAIESATILFIDVVGSTELSQRLSAEAADEVRREHFSILRQAVAETGGTEVKNLGDGLMVVFASASGALACSVAMQQGVELDNRDRDHPIGLRVGLSGGELIREEDDYFGDPVVEAARLCATCESGQILAIDVVRAMAGRRSSHECRSLGELTLKGLSDPVETVEVLWEPLRGVDALTPIPLPGRLTVRPAVGVVGREAEMQAMTDAVKRVAGGEGREVLLISGEAGLGKTTLVAEAARAAFDGGASVLFGHCEEDLATPYQLFAEALGHYVTHASENQLLAHVEKYGSELSRLVPALASRIPGLPLSQATDPETERFLLFAAVVGLLATASQDQPVVLVFDDLQWADKGSLLLLRHLTAADQAMPVLLLGSFRDTELSHAHPLRDTLVALRRQSGVSRIELAGLDDSGVAAFLEAAAGQTLDDAGVGLADAMYRETDGNPYFVSEMLRHLSETGAIFQDATGRWNSETTLEQVALPDSIREIIGARVGRLGQDAGRVLSLAAIIGRDFDLDLLARAAKINEDEVLDILEAATAAALVHELTDTPGHYNFAHALIQHTLYEDQTLTRRARAHRRVAEALEGLCGDRPGSRVGELARHWTCATQPVDLAKAIGYSKQAGDAALRALAPDDAIRWYQQVLDLAARAPKPDDPLRCRLLVGLGTAQRQVGAVEHRETLIEAVGLARRIDDAELLVGAILAADRGVAGTSGTDVEWVEATQAALVAIGPADSRARARLLTVLSQSIDAREWERRRDLSTEAVDVARRLADDATLLAILPVAYQHYEPEALDLRLAETAEAIALADRLGDPLAGCNALFHRIDACMQAADLVEVDLRLAELSALAQSTALPLHLWQLHMTNSFRALVDGRCDDAETEADAALEIGTAGGHAEATLAYGVQLLEIRRHQGRLGEMVGFLSEIAPKNLTAIGFRQLLASVYSDVDRFGDARVLLAQDMATDFGEVPLDDGWLTIMLCCATTAAALNDYDASRVLYERLLPYERRIAAVYATVSGAVARHLGRLASVLRRDIDAESHFRIALELHEQIRAPYWTACTHLDICDLLVRRQSPGDVPRARELADRARLTAQERGYLGLLARSSTVDV